MNVLEGFILKQIKRKVAKWFELERSIASKDNVYRSVPASPEKSWPNPDKIPMGGEVPFSLKNIPIVGQSLSSCIHQGMKAIKSLEDNPRSSKTNIDEAELKRFEELAKSKGIGAIGYAKLPQHLIFKDRAVLFDTAIVLTMEMDKHAVMKAPSVETFKMVMTTYDTLGIAVNSLTDQLRTMGFQAQASHPLGGLVLYPPLAVEAGLGWFGRHGLLITPQFGPAQRIAAIFVNIDNLPVSTENPHQWIEDFCSKCGKCIRACPSKAILEEPMEHESGRKTQIIRDKCLSVFVKEEGCTVCVKACAFTNSSYDDIKAGFKKNNEIGPTKK